MLTESEFARRGNSTTIDGNQVRFDSYDEYVAAKIEDAYNNGRGSITEDETVYLLAIYGLGE
jgi:hypothetical protein